MSNGSVKKSQFRLARLHASGIAPVGSCEKVVFQAGLPSCKQNCTSAAKEALKIILQQTEQNFIAKG
eukprot:1142808-Pelagomonas_calceolata.AAC.5